MNLESFALARLFKWRPVFYELARGIRTMAKLTVGKKARTPRQKARVRGERFYETGTPCSRGHVASRYTSSSNCVECSREGYKGK